MSAGRRGGDVRGGGYAIARRVVAAWIFGLVLLADAASHAQTAETVSHGELARRAAETAAAAHAESRRLDAERRALDEELASLGPRIVERETALNAARDRLDALRAEVARAEERLSASQARLRRLLIAAQLAAREPTPSLLVHPDRPVDAARSALLLRHIGAELRRENAAARAERDRIAAARSDAERVTDEARRALFAVQEDEARVAALMRKKEDAMARAAGAAVEAEAEAARLRDAARDLTELSAAIRRAPAPLRPAERAVERDPTPPQNPRAALARPFVDGRGALLRPVAGRLARPSDRASGASDERRRGVTFVTEPYARVIAPWDGTVRYSGPFPGYGHIVIIEPQNDYQILLTGLASVDRQKNDRVLAGEPVGRMGGPRPTTSEFLFEVSAPARAAREHLYFEIRKRGDAIDPTPWLRPETL